MRSGATVVAVAVVLGAAIPTAAARSSCAPTVVFRLTATRPQIDAVKARLRRDRAVAGFRFVSRAQAFTELRRKYPDLANRLMANPLPARIELRLRAGVDRSSFVRRWSRLHLAGVRTVRSMTPDGVVCA